MTYEPLIRCLVLDRSAEPVPVLEALSAPASTRLRRAGRQLSTCLHRVVKAFLRQSPSWIDKGQRRSAFSALYLFADVALTIARRTTSERRAQYSSD
jgi:hypothetical protein